MTRGRAQPVDQFMSGLLPIRLAQNRISPPTGEETDDQPTKRSPSCSPEEEGAVGVMPFRQRSSNYRVAGKEVSIVSRGVKNL
jgi:hypothetical protein